MDVGQLVFVRHDTNVTPSTGGTLGSSSIAIAGPRLRSAAATARQALLGLASTSLGVPVESLTRQQGRRLRRRQVRHLRRARRRPALRRRDGGDVASTPGVAPAKKVGDYRSSGRTRPADRHPGEGQRHLHLRARRQAARDAARPRRAAPRPGRLRRRLATAIVSVDERSIKHIRGARVVRRGDFLGVVATHEYDAIQAAAQLKVVVGGAARDLRAAATSGSRCATSTRGPGAGADRVEHGQRRRGVRLGARKPSGELPPTTTRPHADRPELRRRRRDRGRRARDREHAGRLPHAHERSPALLGLPPNKIRVQYWEGAGSFGNGAGPARRRRGGGGHVAARRRAGAAAVHALGRARLGQLRAGA